MFQDELVDFIHQMKSGVMHIIMTEGSRVRGKLLDVTPTQLIIDCDKFYNKSKDHTMYNMGRLGVEKKRIEKYMVLLEGGKKD